MRSRSKHGVAAIALLGLLTLLVAPTAAAAKSSATAPGLLRRQDLTGGLQQVGETSASTTLSTPVVDSTACTEVPQAVDGIKTVVAAQYAPVGAAVGAVALFEDAVAFTNTRTAKTAYALLAKNTAAAIACSAVGFVPPGATAPAVTFKFTHVDFPKIAGGSYAASVSVAAISSIPTTQVVFVSGSNLVIMGATGTSAPGPADLKTIAINANKRLEVLTPVPTTTSTTAPKPLTVDPVTSRCADEGKVVSPSSSQAGSITFSNQTNQTLKIYWLDYTGARKPYGEVAPGATTTQATFVGHYWMLADATDKCARIAPIDGASFTMTVTG